jgi:hypothetical protein
MKTYWGSGSIALDLGSRWRWVVSFTPGLDAVAKKKCLAPVGNRAPIIQPVGLILYWLSYSGCFKNVLASHTRRGGGTRKHTSLFFHLLWCLIRSTGRVIFSTWPKAISSMTYPDLDAIVCLQQKPTSQNWRIMKGQLPGQHVLSRCNCIGCFIWPFNDGLPEAGIALGYGLDDRYFESRQGLGIFLFTTASRPALGPTQFPIQWVRGADHTPSSSAEVNARSCTFTPSIRLHGVVLS